MNGETPRTARAVAIAAIVLPAAFVGYGLTTFLFAFSGGQSRMVAVVNLGALIVIVVDVIAAVAWWRRVPRAALTWTAWTTLACWLAAIVGEWLISFRLGAA